MNTQKSGILIAALERRLSRDERMLFLARKQVGKKMPENIPEFPRFSKRGSALRKAVLGIPLKPEPIWRHGEPWRGRPSRRCP